MQDVLELNEQLPGAIAANNCQDNMDGMFDSLIFNTKHVVMNAMVCLSSKALFMSAVHSILMEFLFRL